MRLDKALLAGADTFPDDLKVPLWSDLPEKVVQFGEGNFLRAFVDWMLHRLIKAGRFDGKVVVVQPIPEGMVEWLNTQDGLYTLLLRGIQNGREVLSREIITSVSRGINPYTDWAAFLALAENPDLRFMVSNTTEAGIAYTKEAYTPNLPIASFPGKLTAFLFHRYQNFGGAADKGLIHLPCELIDRNGDQLKTIVLQLASEWSLPAGFRHWIKAHNCFCSTLVDRIVTGYPHTEADTLAGDLGYEDRLLDTGEIFHLWVIEGPSHLKAELPLHEIGLNVIWTDDLKPYRERKVRVLNGAHTMTMAVAYLSGLDTVKSAVDDPKVGRFMYDGIFDEILPQLDLAEQEKRGFAESVLERFQNPYIYHKWLDISLNSISKFKTRCLPTLLDTIEHTGKVPQRMAFALAALIAFYKGERNVQGRFFAQRGDAAYPVRDDDTVLVFFDQLWKTHSLENVEALIPLVQKVLAHTVFWGRDLAGVDGLAFQVAHYLFIIITQGMRPALDNLLETLASKRA